MSDNLQSSPELQLHQRLLSGDKTASAEIAEAFIDRLVKQLQFKYRQTDEQEIADAATTALMDYLEHPHKYKPELRSLYGYLKMAAEGDMNNALAKQKRRDSHLKMVSLDDVAFLSLAGNVDVENEIIIQQEAYTKLAELKQKQATTNVLIANNELDVQLLALMDADIGRTSEFSKVLAISHLPKDEQKRIVKQHKDRLKLRRKRKLSG